MTEKTDSITAVTGSPDDAAQVQTIVGEWTRPNDRLVVGNWADPDLLAGEQFDTVVADYLLGAVEGFAPYFQASLFARLRRLTLKRLYVTGVKPYVQERPDDAAGALIWEIGRYHDACLLFLGEKPFREYPLEWVLAQLPRSGFQPIAARKFPLSYRENFVTHQIDLVRPKLQWLEDERLGNALIAHGEDLRSRAIAHIETHGSLQYGFAYAVVADPA
jgi:hypothetical protein